METRPGSYLATLRHYCCYYFFFFFFCCCRCLYAVGVTIFGHWPIGHGWQKSPNHWENPTRRRSPPAPAHSPAISLVLVEGQVSSICRARRPRKGAPIETVGRAKRQNGRRQHETRLRTSNSGTGPRKPLPTELLP